MGLDVKCEYCNRGGHSIERDRVAKFARKHNCTDTDDEARKMLGLLPDVEVNIA